MWRLMGVIVAVLALAGLTLSHGNLAAAPPAVVKEHKQLICHVADASQSFIIEVADDSVPDHLQEHGDCLINSTDRSLIRTPCDPTDANGNDICDIQP